MEGQTERTSPYITGTAYLRTIEGICKIVVMVCSIAGVIVIARDYVGWVINCYALVAIYCSIMALIILICYLTGKIQNMKGFKNRQQFISNVITGCLFLLITILLFINGAGLGDEITIAGVLGIISTLTLFIDAFLNYRKDPMC